VRQGAITHTLLRVTDAIERSAIFPLSDNPGLQDPRTVGFSATSVLGNSYFG
jgi:hypothetical protein